MRKLKVPKNLGLVSLMAGVSGTQRRGKNLGNTSPDDVSPSMYFERSRYIGIVDAFQNACRKFPEEIVHGFYRPAPDWVTK